MPAIALIPPIPPIPPIALISIPTGTATGTLITSPGSTKLRIPPLPPLCARPLDSKLSKSSKKWFDKSPNTC